MRRSCVGLVMSLSAGIFGCTPEWGLTSMCDHPNDFHLDLDGRHVPCNGTEDWCRCAPVPPSDWFGPAPVWIGPDADAPTCGSLGLRDDWEGHTGISPAPECAACACAPPSGSCQLPTEFTAYAAPACPPSGAIQTSFNAPAMWNGSCTTDNGIALDMMCGSGLCVQSLSVGPMLVVEQTECMTIDPPPAVVTTGSPWQALGRVCRATEAGRCEQGNFCLPPVDGVRTCVHQKGEFDCPELYPEKMVFYEKYSDERSCSECSCGPPVGSTCTSQISIYSNTTCSGTWLLDWTHDNKMMPPLCHPLSPGIALGSKKASPPIYTPGACTPSGGEPIGAVVRESPRTVCCIP